VEDAFIVLTATDVPRVNEAVVYAARARRIPVNAADRPELCDFTLPAVGRRGPVTIAVTTSGEAPALASAVRSKVLQLIGPEYSVLARLLGRLRRRLETGPSRSALFRELAVIGPETLRGRQSRRALFARIRRQLSASTSSEEKP
jgi:precorrin-2 dehydrogenase/sirohydrochlorin ferrochelatase